MRQTWTALQHDGPDHLGVVSCESCQGLPCGAARHDQVGGRGGREVRQPLHPECDGRAVLAVQELHGEGAGHHRLGPAEGDARQARQPLRAGADLHPAGGAARPPVLHAGPVDRDSGLHVHHPRCVRAHMLVHHPRCVRTHMHVHHPRCVRTHMDCRPA